MHINPGPGYNVIKVKIHDFITESDWLFWHVNISVKPFTDDPHTVLPF